MAARVPWNGSRHGGPGVEGLPAAAGIGLRAPHVASVLGAHVPAAWFEVHSENYFADGGMALRGLERVRALYPVALHGVGLALGSAGPLDRGHLAKLAALARRIEPAAVSEHVCWGRFGARHFNDLLPLPYTRAALDHFCAQVGAAQDALGRRLLLENISFYRTFPESAIPEPEFLAMLARRTGCGLLLDVNNVFVNAHNHGWNAEAYLDAIPAAAVEEIHLGGHEESGALLIDTHGAPVCEAVWALYRRALERWGARPTLIEWDTGLPPLDVLLAHAARAQEMLDREHALAA
jgi:hypothetical protein